MKLKNLFLSALAIAAVAAGCKKEQGPTGDPSISVSPKTITVSKDADSKVVAVTANRDWKAEMDDAAKEWVTLSQSTGSASASAVNVTITVDENTGRERTASVKFTTGTVSSTLTITQEGAVVTTYTDLAAIRALSEGDVIADDTYIKAQVINDATLNNLTNTKGLFVQAVLEKEAGKAGTGLQLYFSSKPSVTYGDIIEVNVGGMKRSSYNGALQIDANGKAAADVITVLQAAQEVNPIEVSIDDFLANKYEDQYVKIKEPVQVASSDLSKNWYSSASHTSINMETEDGKAFVVFTSKYGSALDKQVAQGSGQICGVANINNSTVQLFFGKTTDADALTGERFSAKIETLTVDQALAASGKTIKVEGRVIAVCPKGIIINDGTQNNLYIYKSGLAFAVNDIVAATGKMSTYYKVVEMTPDEVVASTASIKETPVQIATSIASDNISTWVPSPAGSAPVYIKGKLSISGNYINLEVDGTTVKGSIVTSIDCTEFADKNVEVDGFWTGTSSTYFNLVATNIELDGSDYLSINPTSAKVAADATTASFAISSNIEWTAESKTDGFTIDKTSGKGDDTITLTFAANTGTEAIVATVDVTSTLGTKTYTLTQSAPSAGGDPVYTLDATLEANMGSNNSYAGNCDIKIGDVTWNVTGNTKISPWRIGGKTLDGVDREVYTKTAYGKALSKIVLTCGTSNITVNSGKLLYASKEDFSDATAVDFAVPTSASVAIEASFPKDSYYKFVFNVTETSGSNKYIQFSKVEFYE